MSAILPKTVAARPTGEPTRDSQIIDRTKAFAARLRRRSPLTVEPQFPVPELHWCPKLTAKFRHVLTPEECRELIELSEDAGYEAAMVNVGGGRQILIQDYRNSHRAMIDSPELADAIFSRILPHLANAMQATQAGRQLAKRCGRPREFNERLRFLRYTGGEFFEQHMDGCYTRPRAHPKAGDRSCLTVLLYLNEGYNGATRVFNTNHGRHLRAGEGQEEEPSFHDVVPEAGMLFVHDHAILHSGEPITGGTKYVIRTDIMFTFAKPEADAAAALLLSTSDADRDEGRRKASTAVATAASAEAAAAATSAAEAATSPTTTPSTRDAASATAQEMATSTAATQQVPSAAARGAGGGAAHESTSSTEATHIPAASTAEE